jgi:transposase
MAMQVEPRSLGVDVAKDELVISIDGGDPFTIENTPSAIRAWLKTLHGPVRLAVESTGAFHLELACQAHQRGHEVFVIDGYRLNRYRESVGGRAKTDTTDARLLARYLRNEHADLRPWNPPSRDYQALQRLLHRRATVVRARTSIHQSLREIPELKTTLQATLRQLDRTIAAIERRIRDTLARAGWHDHARRCQDIEGVGPITAAALVMAFARGRFANSDAFIAFLGLDVRIRDSGRKRGQRKLTKQGDGELRRLLYLAAMQAKAKPAWQHFFQRHLERGLARVQALNVLARKLARVAFALMKNETDYVPKSA